MNPNMKKIGEFLANKKYAQLTDAQYERLAGRPLPKDKSYQLKDSALARLCDEIGYELSLQEKTVNFKKKGE